MITNEFVEKIKMLHNDGGKHSNYQNFPVFVTDKIGIKANIDENWRGDSARYEFLENNLHYGEKFNILDIGANTGRFCLDLAYKHRNCNFFAYELNNNYVEYINLIKKEFKLDNILAESISVGLDEIYKMPFFDIIFHMNVLHHAGVDFDFDVMKNFSSFKEYTVEYLSRLSKKCNTLIFQIGYNHGGNKNTPIIDSKNIYEMMSFEIDIFNRSNFQVEKISLYDDELKQYILINYDQMDKEISKNKGSEFYKRPIFILKSTHKDKHI